MKKVIGFIIVIPMSLLLLIGIIYSTHKDGFYFILSLMIGLLLSFLFIYGIELIFNKK